MDYDVQVLGLASPPAKAVVTQYRPAVSILNAGIHDAIASGYVRIYAAGLLVFESEVYTNTLTPGETGNAEAVDYWTPPAEGTYIVQGFVSTPLEQTGPNNNLNPTTIIVGPGQPPTPPTPVSPHASQHEEGGADEVSLEGLHGRAADRQDPTAHASNHEFSGEDPINVSNMPGILAEPQLPVLHAAWHETAGTDPLHIAHISGADALEYLANKGEPAGYAGLDVNGIVPSAQIASGSSVTLGKHYLSLERIWDVPTPPGILCLWTIGSTIPFDWIAVLGIPAPAPGYVWIQYSPA